MWEAPNVHRPITTMTLGRNAREPTSYPVGWWAGLDTERCAADSAYDRDPTPRKTQRRVASTTTSEQVSLATATRPTHIVCRRALRVGAFLATPATSL